ncbi:Signal transduction histidine kinase CheA [hydrothermal vent metagenome]|uniref:histidine kinase n=1 Tax=hydrothermal vent metagenome TaxID=652676 RepID=A0A3B1C6P6_9ZZZZ
MSLNLPENILNDFIDETREILVAVDRELLELEQDLNDTEQINKVFRLIHTLKGSASFLGFDRIVDLMHDFENTLNLARNQKASITPDDIKSLFKRLDTTRDILDDIRSKKLSAGVNFIAEEPKVAKKASAIPDDKKPVKTVAEPKIGEDPSILYEVSKREPVATADQTTRVKLSRLDTLSQLVGELTLRRNQLLTITSKTSVKRKEDLLSLQLNETVTQINRVTTELQDAIMETRMMPLQSVFARFPPLVREIAEKYGKKVRLETEGEQAEVEKIAIEPLSESLTHIISNAIHHGIETPEERTLAGKNEKGTIKIKAWCDGNSIVVTASDDGKGMDTNLIVQKAIAVGNITLEESHRMTEEQILNLVFSPGFSTLDTAGLGAGRGVGMDVVKSSVTRLNGSIKIDTVHGRGTTIELRLPLTLSIIQALIVEVGVSSFVLPASIILETVRIDTHSLQSVDGNELITYRNTPLPVVRLSELFDIPSTPGKWEYVTIVNIAEKTFGIVVDRLKGQEDIAFKPVNDFLAGCGATGATSLGDGSVAFIIDLGEITEALYLFEGLETNTYKKPVKTDDAISYKVLLAEGSKPFRKAMVEAFRKAGYETTEANSGRATLKAIMESKKPFDLIMLDCDLPGIGGIALAEHLKSHAKFKSIPVVALTPPSKQVDTDYGFRIGIEDFLPKLEAENLSIIARRYIIKNVQISH